MTCLEKLKLEHPDDFDEDMPINCPMAYDYAPAPDKCSYDKAEGMTCTACWNRECVNVDRNYNPVQKAYNLVLEFREACDTETELDLDELIGYLGEALDDHPEAAYTDANTMLSDIAKVEEYSEPTIKDSGDRTQFASGAVRDMREGKGRCDLMPLEVVASLMNDDPILHDLGLFLSSNDVDCLYRCLEKFSRNWDDGKTKASFEEIKVQRRCTMLLEVAKHFEEGAKKYGANNWQKGIPTYCYIDSAVRHYLKYLRGDRDEPHDRAFCWNLMCCIWEVDYGEEWRSTIKVKETI